MRRTELVVVVVRVEPEDPDLAGGRTTVALERFDRARLARPVRPEQGHDLAGPGGERQAVDGQGVAVPDDQVLTEHCRRCVGCFCGGRLGVGGPGLRRATRAVRRWTQAEHRGTRVERRGDPGLCVGGPGLSGRSSR